MRRRFIAGCVGTALSVVPVRRHHVGAGERRVFRLVNDLPDGLHPPTWVVMQLGTVGAALVASAGAWHADDRRLAVRVGVAGTTTWALSKVVKRVVRRGRPAALLPSVHCRGKEATGLGYLSGHAGVAVVLGVAAMSRTGPAGRLGAAGLIPVVGLARIYVGAHLPLDVAGGAALGLAIDAAVAWRQGD